ncbi:MAG: M36 family metallopeptidase, partial [Pseudomonadota bacterium]|nr:M36 family metallopeptidase [Pseudomonadota bacterium]
AAPRARIADVLRAQGASEATLASLVEVAAQPIGTSSRQQVKLTQQIGGLAVHGGAVKGIFNADGALVQWVGGLAPIPRERPRPAAVDETRALGAALARVHPAHASRLTPGVRQGSALRFGGDPYFHGDATVTRVLIPQTDGGLAEGYSVQTWSRRGNQLDLTLVGGDGRVLAVENRTANDSYHVFTADPARGPQTRVDGPKGGSGSGQPPSPNGWLGSGTQKSIDITGNNAHAYLDAADTDAPDPGGTVVRDGSFIALANLNAAPTTPANREVAVQNLFYTVNRLHDVLFTHGFDEAAGNFQKVNFTNGGVGNDPVNAEAQDGGGTNNANFATPPDGTSPRMQMYLWTQPGSRATARDGDLDADIVSHEYGHGLTMRMIGKMNGPLAGAVGEGASDVVAFLMNGNDTLASYASGKPEGIRRHRYSGYPLTYADVAGVSVHDDGEIYAAAMWRLRELWLASGRSNDALFALFVDAMNFTAPGPAFEHMRNGLLDSIAQDGGADAAARCSLVWKAFAQFGIGAGAKGSVSGIRVTVTPSTTARSSCDRRNA